MKKGFHFPLQIIIPSPIVVMKKEFLFSSLGPRRLEVF